MRPSILIIALLFVSCHDISTERNLANKDTIQQDINQDTFSTVTIPDSSINSGTELYVWHVDFENKTKRRNPHFKDVYLNVDTLIKGLNELYPNIKLAKVKMHGDTLFTKIMDGEYFGERMGSSGAALYLANVIINLTSVDKIRFVKIDFEISSHASPGIWNANDFSDYKEKR